MSQPRSPIHMSDSLERTSQADASRATKVLLINLTTYAIISIAELTMGSIDHSVALMADGENNFTGIVSVISLIVGLAFSKRPSDDYHLEGHWQFENLAVFVAGLIMLLVGVECIWNGFEKFWNLVVGKEGAPLQGSAAYMAAISGITMLSLSILNYVISHKVLSASLAASARDLFSDALTSMGTMLAIMGAFFLHMHWIDSVAAVLLGLFIIYNGSRILSDSAAKLSNGFSPNIRMKIVQFIGTVHGVQAVSFVDVRYSGSNMIVEAEIEVSCCDSVRKAYEVCKSIEHLLQEKFPILYCCIQVKPSTFVTK